MNTTEIVCDEFLSLKIQLTAKFFDWSYEQ